MRTKGNHPNEFLRERRDCSTCRKASQISRRIDLSSPSSFFSVLCLYVCHFSSACSLLTSWIRELARLSASGQLSSIVLSFLLSLKHSFTTTTITSHHIPSQHVWSSL